MPKVPCSKGWKWQSRKRLIWLSFGSQTYRAHVGVGRFGFYIEPKRKR